MHAAAHPGEQRDAAGDLFGRDLHHAFGFGRRQAVELAGVAVGHQHVYAGGDGAIDDRLQGRGIELVTVIEWRDQDAGDAIEGAAQRHGDSCGL